MKRLGYKISIIIFTFFTCLSVVFSFDSLIEMACTNVFPGLQGLEDMLSLVLYFFVSGITIFFVFGSLLVMVVLSIIFCSIDLYKSISDNDNVSFDIVFMSLNYIFYVFIVVLFLYSIC